MRRALRSAGVHMTVGAQIAEPGGALGYVPRPAWYRRIMQGSAAPVLIVCLAILAIWYVSAVLLNIPFAREKLERAGPYTTSGLVTAALNDERPVLPSPHQDRKSTRLNSSHG